MIAINFTPVEEARIADIANKMGVEPSEYVRNLVREHIPIVKLDYGVVDQEDAAAIAQFETWLKEDSTNDPDVISQAAHDLNELIMALNKNRIEADERPLFSE